MAEMKQGQESPLESDPAAAEGREGGMSAEVPTTGDLAPEIAEHEDEFARVTSERDEYLDHLQRLQAEFDNYRKRVQRDGDAARLRAAEVVVESLLPVVDNLARALEAADQHGQGQLTEGLQLVAGQLRSALAAHGLDELEVAVGTPFDPAVHEAVLTQESESEEEGMVVQVLERGYLLHGRLLRPAKVIVAR